MPRTYSMRAVQPAAELATQLCRELLTSLEPGANVHDVQDDPRFRHRGIDLLWESSSGSVTGVEVKGDRNGRRGNYFFELVSNLEKDTPGCFLYSQAEYYAYVLLAEREVHLLPLAEVRAWFLPRAKDFPLRRAQTRAGRGAYTTVGALVPIRTVTQAVPSLRRFELAHGTWRPRERSKR